MELPKNISKLRNSYQVRLVRDKKTINKSFKD
jgi:hypothetical protein